MTEIPFFSSTRLFSAKLFVETLSSGTESVRILQMLSAIYYIHSDSERNQTRILPKSVRLARRPVHQAIIIQ